MMMRPKKLDVPSPEVTQVSISTSSQSKEQNQLELLTPILPLVFIEL